MKPSIPKGTRDFSSIEVTRRNYIFNTIKNTFDLFGFQPIETPCFENLSTLMGKYGDEGDRLIYKVLNSGDFLSKVDTDFLLKKNSIKIIDKISEKGLRFDLTVPFARYVVQHQNDIVFPFKRYQIQPVWRADRPQKGRFREFYQCDADVVGSTSLMQEVEFVQLYDTVFSNLKLNRVIIKINNRKILLAITQLIGAKDKLIDFTVALDKLDKIGIEGVEKEMQEKGISKEAIEKAKPLFTLAGSNENKLSSLENMLFFSEEGRQGVKELRFIIDTINKVGLKTASLELDVTLARGLNYYTGAIYEVIAPLGIKIGSIGGGGRYDDLTGVFGLKNMPGVGISFGLDRIYLVMEELGLFETIELPKPQILFLNFDKNEFILKIKAINKLREKGIKAELYTDIAKTNNQQKKQWKYADKRNINIVVCGIESNLFNVKNRIDGSFKKINLNQLIELTI